MSKTEFFKNTVDVFNFLGTEKFGQALINIIHTEVLFDGSVIILFHPQHEPKILQEGLSIVDHKFFWKSYMKDLYTLDPFYKLCSQGKKGMYHLQDIMPWDFDQSRYFKQYFDPADLKDEVNFIFQASDGVSGLICVSRSETQKRFSKEEQIKLKNMAEFIDVAILRHLEISNAQFEDYEGHSQLPLMARAALDNFNDDNLTEREHEITHLMLRGYSSKAIANFLKISPETERTHRKNIYKKMNVNSHVELLASVFEALLKKRVPTATELFSTYHENNISRIRYN